MEMIADQMRAKIGTEKLHQLVGTLAGGMEPLRAEAQVQKLKELIDKARESIRKSLCCRSVVTVCRTGLGTVEFLRDGERRLRERLGRRQEAGHGLSGPRSRIQPAHAFDAPDQSAQRDYSPGCGDAVPEIVYVSDAGKIETAYWKDTLRKFFVDGRRIKITRVVDYYHAAERLTKIADALKLGGDKAKRKQWLKHARWLLRQPGGHGKMLRSIGKMRELHGYKKSAEDEAEKAERYLRRYGRFMAYAEMKSRGYPIGGIGLQADR